MKTYVIAFSLIFCCTSAVAKTLNFVSIERLFEQEVGKKVIPQIFNKLSIDVNILPAAAKRAKRLLDMGAVDGEIMRILSYGENMNSVIRVPTPYYALETMGFIKKSKPLVVHSPSDLESVKVVVVRGGKTH